MNTCLACGHGAHEKDCEFIMEIIRDPNDQLQANSCGCNVTGYVSEPTINMLREEWNFLVVNAHHRFFGKPREEMIEKIKDLAAFCLKFTTDLVAGTPEQDLTKLSDESLHSCVVTNIKQSLRCLDELDRREALR